jgi:hypothetical protein
LKYKGIVNTPADWLIAQIGGYSGYITSIYTIIEQVVPANKVTNLFEKIYTDLTKVESSQFGYILDEAQVLIDFASDVVSNSAT